MDRHARGRSTHLAWDLVVEHPRRAAFHAVLEGAVHVANAAPVHVVWLEGKITVALWGYVTALSGCQEPVQAV